MKIVATVIWLIYGAIIAAAINSAKAHSWYESSCCGGEDCKPVPDGTVTETKEGVVVKDWGIMSESDGRLRWSQDERDHICISKATFGAPTGKLLCVYRKRKFM